MQRKRLASGIVALAAAGTLVSPAFAQQVTLPSAAEGGRLERDREQPPAPVSREGAAPAAPVGGEVKAPEGAENVYFTLTAIEIEGMGQYSAEELLRPYDGWRGERISLAQVYEVASAILQRYRQDGFGLVMVYLPPQQIAEGRVRIAVVEGVVRRVTFEDMPESELLAGLRARITAMKPLHMPTLEEELLLLNDLPGITAQATLEPDEENGEPGVMNLRVKGQKKALDAVVAADNSGSRYLGPWQGQAQLRGNGIVTPFGRTALSFLSSIPMKELRYFGVQHTEPLSMRTSVSLAVSRSHSEPGFRLKPQEVENESESATLSARYVWIRSRAKNLAVNAQFDVRNLDTDLLGTEIYRDRIRALRFTATYDALDDWRGLNLVSATLSQGLDALGARNAGSQNISRAEGRSDFTTLQLTLTRLQGIDENFSLYGAATGQYSRTPLLSAEEFGYGGPYAGRAYDPSEITGDRGVNATMELRWNAVNSEAALPFAVQVQPFAFYDIGKVWNLDRGGEMLSGASAGLGARTQLGESISATATAAWPLTRTPSSPLRGNAEAPRFGLSVSMSY